MKADTGSLSENRSDVKAIEKNNCLKSVEDWNRKAKLLPEFGVNYVHMLTLEMVRNNSHWWGWSQSWSSKMNKANISSFKIKNESLDKKKWSKRSNRYDFRHASGAD
jgi:hypothetical protein